MARTLLQFIVFAVTVHTGLSVYCFNCNSRASPKCADPFDEAALAYWECSDKFKLLIDKTTAGFDDVREAFKDYPSLPYGKATCQKLVIDEDGEAVTFRSCSVSDINFVDTCENHKDNLGRHKVKFCGQCETGLCNRSTLVSTNLAFLTMTILITAIKNIF